MAGSSDGFPESEDVIVKETIRFTLNGEAITLETDPERKLLWVLRTDLAKTGTKYGCGEGQCGACTVLMNGKKTLSCITPVARADKKKITTIEGLADGDLLHPIQQAFLDEGAIQCGYCSSGMILATAALLKNNPKPTDQQITEWMNGNICRCNGYTKIINAVRRAASQMKEVRIP